ncbi:hypothetical protein H6503_05335 [Candidatus Woesearchaeota archaeon]|nr:hypothetical protein [Candidatus Woesearchaeota archaeon]
MKVQNYNLDICRKIALSVFFFAFLVSVSALQLEVRNTLQEDFSVLEELTIIVQNHSSSIEFVLPSSVMDVTLDGMPADVNNNSLMLDLCNGCIVELSYIIPDASMKGQNGEYKFSRSMNVPFDVDNLIYEIYLPLGYIIGTGDASSVPNIAPNPTSIGSDGKHIMISWKQANPQLPEVFQVIYRGHEGTETVASEFGNELTEWPVWVLMVLFLVLGTILGLLIAYFSPKSNNAEIIPSSLFTPDEKKVIEMLEKTESQKEVGAMLSWSKSKVSSIMTTLEFKKVISREKIGRNYKVKLLKKPMD